MMIPRSFIRTEQELLAIESEASAVFELLEKFPGQVFRTTMGFYRFLDFTKFAQPEFWTMLVALTRIFGDHTIYLLTQEPSPAEYKKWMNVFGALRFSSMDTDQEYAATLQYEFNGGIRLPALYFSVSNIRWFGSSKKWGIYGDRDLDLAIVSIQGTPQQEAEWKSLAGPLWLSNQEADAAVRSNTNHKKQELKPFVETLFKNYKINV
jgi:hypothetical protein